MAQENYEMRCESHWDATRHGNASYLYSAHLKQAQCAAQSSMTIAGRANFVWNYPITNTPA